MEGNMAKSDGFDLRENCGKSKPTLTQAEMLDEAVRRARMQHRLMQLARLAYDMIGEGKVSPRQFRDLEGAFGQVTRARKDQLPEIDLEPLRELIDQKENLAYMRRQRDGCQLLLNGQLTVRDLKRQGMLPQESQKFRRYLELVSHFGLREFLAFSRDEHYLIAGELKLTEDFLDDLDAMLRKLLGFGLESRQGDIEDTCRIYIEVLDSSIDLTEKMEDWSPERNCKDGP
jgi:hypothetical protein